MKRWTEADRRFMQVALDLAERGRGYVEPNPMVGCVIVRGGRVVGEGYHRRYGLAHAEIVALRRAGSAARGGTVYVTLEPCGHLGKTPPCAEALIDAGVRRVVAAMKDPNPRVAGRGFRMLRAAGVRVDTGLLRAEALRLNAPFVVFHREKRPYVILKWAQSIDGKIATRTGHSKWITSVQSRKAGHVLRARVDAVIVGVGTVLADDPDLTARMAKPRRPVWRVVLDSQLRIPKNARVVRSVRKTPTLIVMAKGCNKAGKRRELEGAGCRVLAVRGVKRGVHLPSLLRQLHRMEMTNVLVEGGGAVLGSFFEQGLCDEGRVFVAPRLVGGEGAPGPLGGLGPDVIDRSTLVRVLHTSRIGPDLCYSLRFRKEL